MTKHNVFRDGQVHILADRCTTCIFRPDARPVEGRRVAELVRETKDTEAATVPCHQTLYTPGIDNAICRGWWDRFAARDPILRLAVALRIVAEDPPPKEH